VNGDIVSCASKEGLNMENAKLYREKWLNLKGVFFHVSLGCTLLMFMIVES
jgi:hypothetical protein